MPEGGTREPPTNLIARLKYLGPSIIISGSIVGSGEIILTSSLGAAAGFLLLWWVLLSCWIKSLVQAELSRYIIVSGDTYLRALNRLPGKIPGPRGPVAWPIWMGLIAFIPGIMGLSGIIGGAGQALTLLVPQIPSTWATAVVAVTTASILAAGSYRVLEKILLGLVVGFTACTLVCATMMQSTEFAMSSADIASGLTFEFPMEYLVMALAVYGYTGVNSGETAAYTYWCIEKGYPGYIGHDRQHPDWLKRARGWIGVLHLDVWATLLILTCATIPFYLLGAGVLNAMGEQPDGLETISVLSNMFTATLGGWSLWVFGVGAFFILFSTTLSGVGGGGRFIPDYLIELGFFPRTNLALRKAWTRGYVICAPLFGLLCYIAIPNPVFLVTIGAVTAALFLPIQSGATLWLQARHMDASIQPRMFIKIAIAVIFLFQLLMAGMVITYVVF
jgi:Mn2+/Fe2+ NRAMP family transporter|tara:strand:+ start:3313 stop:4653 length:1341 start_codon:yes stop_codon:yes gene_type:complete